VATSKRIRSILVSTDGSGRAGKGIREGVRLARALRAKVIGVYVISPSPAAYGEHAHYYQAGLTPADYRRYTRHAASKALDVLESAAKKAGVRCATRFVTDEKPWHGILRAARATRADLIVMASHGRGAISTLLLGSETSRVLAQSKIPVLVAR